MTHDTTAGLLRTAALLCALHLTLPSNVLAQDRLQRQSVRAAGDPVGIDVFGGTGLSWPAAKDSIDAVDLNSRAFDVGGGARVTGLWRTLFAQVSAARWSDTGERAFIASDGTVFRLGIPLDVRATFVDATVGLKNASRNASGRITHFLYAGAGAGVVRYRERSPFAEPGDDLETTKPSYHVLLGVEVPIAGPLAVAVDGRYRHVPGLLGEGGVSGELEDDLLSGFQAAVGLRFGFGGPRRIVPPPVRSAPAAETAPRAPAITEPAPRSGAVIVEEAPVYALPDASRTPLRTLPAGTSVRILDENDDWVRVQFNDPQWGRRVGYVQRKFVQLRKAP